MKFILADINSKGKICGLYGGINPKYGGDVYNYVGSVDYKNRAFKFDTIEDAKRVRTSLKHSANFEVLIVDID